MASLHVVDECYIRVITIRYESLTYDPNMWRQEEFHQTWNPVMGILILLTLMNGDVATVNNDELSDIQYIKCTYYLIRSKRINVYGHACTWSRDRRITWDDTITLQHENTTTKPIITNIDISTVTQQSENVGIRVIIRTVIVQRALEALER